LAAIDTELTSAVIAALRRSIDAVWCFAAMCDPLTVG